MRSKIYGAKRSTPTSNLELSDTIHGQKRIGKPHLISPTRIKIDSHARFFPHGSLQAAEHARRGGRHDRACGGTALIIPT
jgi:hypothetical protein